MEDIHIGNGYGHFVIIDAAAVQTNQNICYPKEKERVRSYHFIQLEKIEEVQKKSSVTKTADSSVVMQGVNKNLVVVERECCWSLKKKAEIVLLLFVIIALNFVYVFCLL